MTDPILNNEYKLILIGDSSVGKTSLLKYFIDGEFNAKARTTVAVDFHSRLVEVKPGVNVKLQTWDTAGQERFR